MVKQDKEHWADRQECLSYQCLSDVTWKKRSTETSRHGYRVLLVIPGGVPK